MTNALILCSTLVSAYAAKLRAGVWARTQTQPLTIALIALGLWTLIGHATLINEWIDTELATRTGLMNLGDLIGDLIGCIGAWGLCTHVAQAWMRRLPVTFAATSLAALLITFYVFSDARTTDLPYITRAHGLGISYALVTASAIIIVNGSILATVLLARRTPVVVCMGLGATCGVIAGISRVYLRINPELAHDLSVIPRTFIPLAVIFYAFSSIAGYRIKTRKPIPVLERV